MVGTAPSVLAMFRELGQREVLPHSSFQDSHPTCWQMIKSLE